MLGVSWFWLFFSGLGLAFAGFLVVHGLGFAGCLMVLALHLLSGSASSDLVFVDLGRMLSFETSHFSLAAFT